MVKSLYKRIRANGYNNWSKLENARDVVFEIFSRLPVETLAMCEIVCKRWFSWIRSPDFVKLHLSFSRQYYIIYFQFPCGMITTYMDESGELFEGNEGSDFPDLEELHLKMICSYNGLICCINNVSSSSNMIKTDIYIINPVTRKTFLLPKRHRSEQEPAFGVAFGPRLYDYNVFRFFKPRLKSKQKFKECEIYSSHTRSWKKIGIVPQCQVGPMGSNHIFVDGKVYWLVSSEGNSMIPTSILAVDSKKMFQTICLPCEATKYSFLVDLKDRLSMVIVNPDKSYLVEIWVLMNFIECIWVKKCSSNIPPIPDDYRDDDHGSVNSVTVRMNDMLFSTTNSYLIFNMDTRSWKIFGDLVSLGLRYVFPYVQSLLPCDGMFETYSRIFSYDPDECATWWQS